MRGRVAKVIPVAIVVVGFAVGVVVGRWRALAAAGAVAALIWLTGGNDPPAEFVAAVGGVIAAASIAGGVGVRKAVAKIARNSR